MKVAITGTPGTGKSTVAAIAAAIIGYSLIDLNSFAKKHGILCGKDKKRGSMILDEAALGRHMSDITENSIIEGHLSHYARPDIAIVLRLEPEELEKRLAMRGWKKDKVKENVEAEVLGVCLSEALDECKPVFEIDTTGKSANEVAEEVACIVRGKNRKKYVPGYIDWLETHTPKP